MYKSSDNSRIVYRVESTIDGRGIYVGSLMNLRMVDEDSENFRSETQETLRVCLGDVLVGGNIDSKRHPAPQSDSKLCDIWEHISNRKEYSFGFSSLTQYKKWLNKHERSITTRFLNDYLRYRLVAYRVDKDQVIIGDRQCIFKKESAKKVLVMCSDIIDQDHYLDDKLVNNTKMIKAMAEWCALTNSTDFLADSRYHCNFYLSDWLESIEQGKIKVDLK